MVVGSYGLLRPLKYASMGRLWDSVTPGLRPKARLLDSHVLPSAFKIRSDGPDPNFQVHFD